eukprot:scaffold12086_cov160-Amphora_coffeaeformis.AAC.9
MLRCRPICVHRAKNEFTVSYLFLFTHEARYESCYAAQATSRPDSMRLTNQTIKAVEVALINCITQFY